MKKSFSEKLEDLKPKPRDLNAIERKLLPRVKFMAYVMYSLCIASVLFAIFVPKTTEPEVETQIEESGFPGSVALDAIAEFFTEDEELTPTEVLNFYVVGFTFALVGVGCSVLYRKKKKTLFAHIHQPPPEHGGQ
ncbi:MAG: hypothetical protein HYX67_02195 [Candidatus Melainabacteria bacterium]|nr:hypothetical protein [Candidatus Melainabacteria bacterium]